MYTDGTFLRTVYSLAGNNTWLKKYLLSFSSHFSLSSYFSHCICKKARQANSMCSMKYGECVFNHALFSQNVKYAYFSFRLLICLFYSYSFCCLPPLFPQMVFYMQDSDDVYGMFRFNLAKEQSIQSQPEGRFLSLNFLRDGGMLGDVSMTLTALYIPAGPIDPKLARDQVLNVSRSINVVFTHERAVHIILPIRNDAFLQNGAHFLIQVTILETS